MEERHRPVPQDHEYDSPLPWDHDVESLTRYPRIWLLHGIETHVIGLPGSEPAESLLRAIAEAGGTELYLAPKSDDPDDSAEDFEDEMDVVCE